MRPHIGWLLFRFRLWLCTVVYGGHEYDISQPSRSGFYPCSRCGKLRHFGGAR